MTNFKRLQFQIFAAVLLFIFIGLQLSEAGRGGGSRGGSRSSRSSSRSSRTTRRSSGTRAGSVAWKVALVAGVYYGSQRYMRRGRYHSGHEPQICENRYKIDTEGVRLGKFICPLGELPDDYSYCCGSDYREHCCKFFDSPGRTAGVVIAILICFLIVGAILFCCCRRHRKSQLSNKTPANKRQTDQDYHKSTHPAQHETHKLQPVPPAATMNQDYPVADNSWYPPSGAPYYPPQGSYGAGYSPAGAPMETSGYPPAGAPMGMSGYPPAGAPMGMPGYPAAGAPMGIPPPAYEESKGLPYSLDPTHLQGPGAPPPMPSAPNLPYPMNPGMPHDAPPPGFTYNQPNLSGQGYTG